MVNHDAVLMCYARHTECVLIAIALVSVVDDGCSHCDDDEKDETI